MIYIGEKAKEILRKILDDRNCEKCQGFFAENNRWIAFDNKNGECYVEEFDTDTKAICWIEQFYEISEIDIFKVFRLSKKWMFIPKNGFLKIFHLKDTLTLKFYHLPFRE
jgi:hypothetical protein